MNNSENVNDHDNDNGIENENNDGNTDNDGTIIIIIIKINESFRRLPCGSQRIKVLALVLEKLSNNIRSPTL